MCPLCELKTIHHKYEELFLIHKGGTFIKLVSVVLSFNLYFFQSFFHFFWFSVDLIIIVGQHRNEGVSSADNLVSQLSLGHFPISFLFLHSSYWRFLSEDSFLGGEGGAALIIVVGKLLFSKESN